MMNLQGSGADLPGIPADECAKMRVTDRETLSSCLDFLSRKGFSQDEVVHLLVRHFYVDLDQLAEAMRIA